MTRESYINPDRFDLKNGFSLMVSIHHSQFSVILKSHNYSKMKDLIMMVTFADKIIQVTCTLRQQNKPLIQFIGEIRA